MIRVRTRVLENDTPRYGMHTVCVSLRMGTAEKMASRGPGFIIIIMCVTLPSQTPTLLTQMSIGVGRSFWLQPHMGCKWRSEFAIGMPWGRLLVPFCPSDPQPPPPPMPPLEVTGLPPCGIPGETSRRPQVPSGARARPHLPPLPVPGRVQVRSMALPPRSPC